MTESKISNQYNEMRSVVKNKTDIFKKDVKNRKTKIYEAMDQIESEDKKKETCHKIAKKLATNFREENKNLLISYKELWKKHKEEQEKFQKSFDEYRESEWPVSEEYFRKMIYEKNENNLDIDAKKINRNTLFSILDFKKRKQQKKLKMEEKHEEEKYKNMEKYFSKVKYMSIGEYQETIRRMENISSNIKRESCGCYRENTRNYIDINLDSIIWYDTYSSKLFSSCSRSKNMNNSIEFVNKFIKPCLYILTIVDENDEVGKNIINTIQNIFRDSGINNKTFEEVKTKAIETKDYKEMKYFLEQQNIKQLLEGIKENEPLLYDDEKKTNKAIDNCLSLSEHLLSKENTSEAIKYYNMAVNIFTKYSINWWNSIYPLEKIFEHSFLSDIFNKDLVLLFTKNKDKLENYRGPFVYYPLVNKIKKKIEKIKLT